MNPYQCWPVTIIIFGMLAVSVGAFVVHGISRVINRRKG